MRDVLVPLLAEIRPDGVLEHDPHVSLPVPIPADLGLGLDAHADVVLHFDIPLDLKLAVGVPEDVEHNKQQGVESYISAGIVFPCVIIAENR